MGCRGVSGVKGLNVVATGWMYLDGDHMNRAAVKRAVEQKGGRFQPEFSQSTDLLLLGRLRDHQIQSDREGGVDALEQLMLSRRRRLRHVHLVATGDLRDLLDGQTVPCRLIPREWMALKTMERNSIRRQSSGLLYKGDRVTGAPCHPGFRKQHPSVTGYYDKKTWKFMGEWHLTEFVVVGDSYIDCDDIRPAEARESNTILG